MEYNKIVNGALTPLTEEEITQFISEQTDNQTIKEQTSYVEKRLLAYPSFGEQLDMLYHYGYDYWKAHIQSIKEAYPKPNLE